MDFDLNQLNYDMEDEGIILDSTMSIFPFFLGTSDWIEELISQYFCFSFVLGY